MQNDYQELIIHEDCDRKITVKSHTYIKHQWQDKFELQNKTQLKNEWILLSAIKKSLP